MTIGTKVERSGFTLIEFLFVVVVLTVFVALLLPGLARRNVRSAKINCVNNLKQIGLSFRQWALDNNDKFPMQVSVTNGGTMELIGNGNVFVHFLVMSNELSTPKLLFCPQETNPNRQAAWTFSSTSSPGYPSAIPFTNDHNVSYFVGLDARENSPQTIIAGDDNLAIRGARVNRGILSLWTNTPVAWTKERHVNQGNFCFADGSVQGLSSKALTPIFQATGFATNRLVFP